ncbi:MAG: glycoside hydrolase family 130 protein [Clostridia bacterium]|nr:glycoside hydrolase family 130 protein [Clostridia bacterium]
MEKSHDIINKLDRPVLTKADVPYSAELVFNAGVCKAGGKYIMVFRNDYGNFDGKKFEGTSLGTAFSDDGIKWDVSEKILSLRGENPEIKRIYDPRLTVIDDEIFICFACDTYHGLMGGVGRLHNFSEIEILSLLPPDNRNLALFPEKVNGNYVLLERPMPVYSRGKDRFDMWVCESPDLINWGSHRLIMGVEDVAFADNKIGPAAPPVRTEKGWLTLFHAVEIDPARGKNGWEDKWQKIYRAGIMLLDLENPGKIIGYCADPLIVCDRDYELENGFRKDVIFPGGMILEDSGEVKIYYGASDTVECLATADVNDLISICR